MKTIKDKSLYLVISEECCMGRSILEIAENAIAGGVDIVQMREKKKSLQELVKIGKDLGALCERKGAMFIVNDDPMLAQRIGADGVHLGQEDIDHFPLMTVRDIIGQEKMIGISTSSRDQFKKANEADVDYIAFGPIFPTTLKDHHIGTDDIEYVVDIARKPVFFIGGINLSNIDDILSRGGQNIAVIRAITEAGDIRSGAKQLKDKIRKTTLSK
jgi:thiamine-phosphate pyrophosphorylase